MYPESNFNAIMLPCTLGHVLHNENIFTNYSVFKFVGTRAPALEFVEDLILFYEVSLN